MPPTTPNPNNNMGFQFIWQQIQLMKNQLAAFLTVIPIVDNHGNTQVIIGNMATDPRTGKTTGLTGYGIAFLQSGTWRSLAAMTYP